MIETVLRMIQAITFGIRIAVMEPYIEATIHFAIDIITSHQKEVFFNSIRFGNATEE